MKAYPRPRGVGGGWSALESLVVLAVLSILIAIAYPLTRDLLQVSRTRSISFHLSTHLALARASAIARGQPVAISPQSARWEQGWRVHTDPNENGHWDEGESVLAVHDGDLRVRIQANGATQRYVLFDESGRPIQTNGAFLSGSFLVCALPAGQVTALVMNASGRTRIESRLNRCSAAQVGD